jgi:fumarate reductase subunit C
MPRFAHPDAMKSARGEPTRSAPPIAPAEFPFQGRYRAYTLFDWTGVVYLILGFAVLRVLWALGSGPDAWRALMSQLAHPLYLAFHALALASVVFVAVRFFRLFPKAQPPSIGPLKPPPRNVMHAGLYVAWVVVAGALAVVLAGGIF